MWKLDKEKNEVICLSGFDWRKICLEGKEGRYVAPKFKRKSCLKINHKIITNPENDGGACVTAQTATYTDTYMNSRMGEFCRNNREAVFPLEFE